MPNPETIDGFEFKTELAGGRPGRVRPVSVHGPLANKRKAVVRDNSISPVCFRSVDDVPAGYDRGHLIALSLGGPDHGKNLVPMLSYFNRNTYRDLETLLQAEVRNGAVYIGIAIDYYAEPWWMPSKFTLLRHHGDPLNPDEPMQLHHRVEARRKHRMDDELFSFLTKHNNDSSNDWLKDTDGNLTYFVFGIHAHELPGLGFISDLAPGRFSRRQRECVWALNVFKHSGGAQEGYLFSDASDDTHRNLNPVGCLDFPEVDHITPFSSGGTNSFLNAQLTSAHYNRTKSARPDTGGDSAPLRSSERVKKRQKFQK